jgi:hypothetical protein
MNAAGHDNTAINAPISLLSQSTFPPSTTPSTAGNYDAALNAAGLDDTTINAVAFIGLDDAVIDASAFDVP